MTVTLMDAFTRHQLYLEGYKTGLEGKLDMVLRVAYDETRQLMLKPGATTLNQMTRKQLNDLIRAVNKLQLRRNDAFRERMIAELQAFADADGQLNVRILETTEDNTLVGAWALGTGAATLGIAGLAKGSRSDKERAYLWAKVSNTPDGATGLKPGALLKQYTRYVQNELKATIVRGYANGWTVQETMTEIFGTKSLRYKDGLTARTKRAGASMLHTLIQHVSSTVQAGVASIFYRYYEWVSVLDKGTTKICRMRDGIIYKYRKGPLPPAHYRCRSRGVPVRKGQVSGAGDDTFYSWLKKQPAKVQDDFIGGPLAGKLRKGIIGPQGLGKFRTREALTLKQFVAKFGHMITE